MKIIHLYGPNASGKSTLLKELESQFKNQNILVLREHDLQTLKTEYAKQLKQYGNDKEKVVKKTKTMLQEQQQKLKVDPLLNIFASIKTLNYLIKVNNDANAIILEGSCLPVVGALMDSLGNPDRPFNPAHYPAIPSIYLKVDPEQATKRNIRRMKDYYNLDSSIISSLKQSNIGYQTQQIKQYDELARVHKSIILESSPSIDQSANELKETIYQLIDSK